MAGGGKMKWKIGNRLVLGGFGIATAMLVFVGWRSCRAPPSAATLAQLLSRLSRKSRWTRNAAQPTQTAVCRVPG